MNRQDAESAKIEGAYLPTMFLTLLAAFAVNLKEGEGRAPSHQETVKEQTWQARINTEA